MVNIVLQSHWNLQTSSAPFKAYLLRSFIGKKSLQQSLSTSQYYCCILYYDVLCNTYIVLYNYHCLLPTWCLHDAYMMPTCSWNITRRLMNLRFTQRCCKACTAWGSRKGLKSIHGRSDVAKVVSSALHRPKCGRHRLGRDWIWSHEPFIETITTYQNHHCNTVTSANWRS